MRGFKDAGLIISDFVSCKRKVLELFNIKEDFFIKPSVEEYWEITSPDSDVYILKHGKSKDCMLNSVVVKKEGKPVISVKDGCTAVVALDCVRVCFLFDNAKYIGNMPGSF